MQARGGEAALAARRGDRLGACAAIPWSEPPGRHRRDAVGAERRQIGREGLHRRQRLTIDAALRDGALLDRQDGLAGVAIEHEDEPLLRALDDDVARLAVEGDGGEAWLGRIVVIPDIVVDELEAPDERAGVGLEGDDGIRAAIVAGAQAAVEIGARAGGR